MNFLLWLQENTTFMTSAPRYIELVQAIELAIKLQIIKEGEYLPSERQIAEYLSLSRITVSKAMSVLKEKSVIQRQQGRGTKVSKLINYSLINDSGFTTQIFSKGREVGNHWLLRTKLEASPNVADKLKLNIGAKVSFLRRIRLVDGMPVSLENTYIPEKYLPDPEKLDGSLYALWLERGIVAKNKHYYLKAVACSADVAYLLNIQENVPLLSIEQISRDSQGEILELSNILCDSNIYDIEVQSGI